MHHLHAWASKKLCSMENTDIFKTFATKKFKSTAYFPITIEHHACLSVKPNIIPSVTIYRPSCLINSWPWTQQFNKSFKYTAKNFPNKRDRRNLWLEIIGAKSRQTCLCTDCSQWWQDVFEPKGISCCCCCCC